MMSEANAQNQVERMQELLIASSWTAFLPAIFMLMTLIPAADLVLGLFGPDYETGNWALIILTGFAVINASSGLASNTFNMTGHQGIVLRFNIGQLLIIFVLPPLTHMSGIVGAALAVLVATMVRDIGMGFLLPSKLGLQPGIWSRASAGRTLNFVLLKAGMK